MCNIEFPLVQLLKGGEETSWRVIKAREAGQLAHHCNWLAHHQGSLPTTRALSLPVLAPSNLLRHTPTNTKDKYTNIHGLKYTNIHRFKYTNIHGFKYTNTNTTMVALASIVSVSLVVVVLAKLTLQNIEYFSIRTLWASLATKNPHHLFADSLADSHYSPSLNRRWSRIKDKNSGHELLYWMSLPRSIRNCFLHTWCTWW